MRKSRPEPPQPIPDGRPVRLALLVDATISYGRGIIRGVFQFANENPTRLVVRFEPYLPIGQLPSNWDDVDVIIARPASEAMSEALVASGRPIVNISTARNTDWATVSVVNDDGLAGRMAADAVLASGYRSFAFFGQPDRPLCRGRYNGFAQRLAEEGHACTFIDRRCDQPGDHWADGLGDLPHPSVILAATDDWASHVIRACRSRNLPIPDRLAVMGIDNDPLLCGITDPPLASVELATEAIGYRAAERAMALARGTDPALEGRDRLERIPPIGFVPRASLRLGVVDDHLVARAITLIQQLAPTGINVEQLAEEVGLAKRTLESRMRAAIGRSPGAELRRVRLERAAELLSTSRLSVLQIALESGYSNLSRFSTTFRACYGVTPTVYRRQRTVQPRPWGTADEPRSIDG